MIDRLLVSHRFGIIRHLDFLQVITVNKSYINFVSDKDHRHDSQKNKNYS